MKLKNCKKGFTLVEIIVSIAIISILLLGCLTFFSNSFKNIYFYGTRTKKVFEAQNTIDSVIRDISSGTGNSQISMVPSSLQIKINASNGSSITKTVSGKTVSVDTGGNNKVVLNTFVPD